MAGALPLRSGNGGFGRSLADDENVDSSWETGERDFARRPAAAVLLARRSHEGFDLEPDLRCSKDERRESEDVRSSDDMAGDTSGFRTSA